MRAKAVRSSALPSSRSSNGRSLLCTHPDLGAHWRNKRRRFPRRKFPFSIIYYIRGDELRVVALAHHRRKPDYWTARK